ncbi:uncharacterized protein VP01_590g4 [Puccinia sorghi]|uniref:Uncharacterized protein n=1 Tax=Puccinia sorghi TaxID=27349 RepID=A0A0L6UHU8_9BASI|nr:uncharacterized protein VP01_590g4 [Puccinia sorghi]
MAAASISIKTFTPPPPTLLKIDPLSLSNCPSSKTGFNIYKKIYNKTNAKLREHIKQLSFKTYGQKYKDLQVDSVMNLVSFCDTFLLAGTSPKGKLTLTIFPFSNVLVALEIHKATLTCTTLNCSIAPAMLAFCIADFLATLTLNFVFGINLTNTEPTK